MADRNIYQLTGGHLKRVSAEGKTDLQPGRVIHWGGNQAWSEEDFIIDVALNEGESYRLISLKHYGYHHTQAYLMKFRTEEVSHSQYLFIEDRSVSEDELDSARARAKEKQEKERAERAERDRIRAEQEARGRELAEKYIPPGAKAVIVAVYEVSECDLTTDYFGTRSAEYVILGFSSHTRNVFSEMRKYAEVIPETAHLSIPPDVDENGEKKTDSNKEYWTPADEHRENWAGGHGFYLKAGDRYDTGWEIRKEPLADWNREKIHISLAKRLVLPEPSSAASGLAPGKVDGVTVTLNQEKNGVEIRFPEKPDQSILDALNANRWRWHRKGGFWYNKQTEANIQFANKLAGMDA